MKPSRRVYCGYMPEQLNRMEMKLAELEGKLDALAEAQQKTRNNSRIVLWITIGAIVLPLLIFALVPSLLGSFLASQGVGAGF